MEQGPTCR